MSKVLELWVVGTKALLETYEWTPAILLKQLQCVKGYSLPPPTCCPSCSNAPFGHSTHFSKGKNLERDYKGRSSSSLRNLWMDHSEFINWLLNFIFLTLPSKKNLQRIYIKFDTHKKSMKHEKSIKALLESLFYLYVFSHIFFPEILTISNQKWECSVF